MVATPPITSADTASDSVRWRELLNARYAGLLALVCMGVWLHAADGLLVSTMMRAIVTDIGGANLISWTIALYEVGSIVAGAASGLLTLRYGTRLPMAAAAAVFAVGCAIAALAPNMSVLLVGRLLQGLGGGGLMAISFVSVSVLFPKRLIARAIAITSITWSVSAFLGPLIGGLFVDLASWRGGFWFFGLQAIALMVWVIVRPRPTAARTPSTGTERFPIIRLLWLSAGVVAIAMAGVEISAIRTPGFIVAGLICVVVFIRLDAVKGASRLLPRHPVSLTEPVGAALTMIFCFAAATIAIGVYVPFMITALHGLSALTAGYVIAVEAVVWGVVASLCSGVAERRDPIMIRAGLVIVTASIVVLAISVASGPVWLIAVGAAIQGCGFGMAWTFILRRATAIAPVSERERVSGAIPTVQRFGYAIGAAYIGIVANAAGIDADNDCLATAARAVFVASLPLALLGLVAAARFTRSYEPAPAAA